MPRHGGTYERTRKHRKRRGRNRQSWLDLAAAKTTVKRGKP